MSIIYKNIQVYRIIMDLLYMGKYRKRFRDITALLQENDRSIVELCFGDIVIAQYCGDSGKKWAGYDRSESFVSNAVKKGFSAQVADVSKVASLPRSDVCIIAGSLYHFHTEMEAFLSLILASAQTVIISEPVRNITAQKGVVGTLAAHLSNAGNGKESFRYTRTTLTEMLEAQSKKLMFDFQIISCAKDLLIRITHENH